MKHKTDREIGKRAAEEILKRGGSVLDEMRELGLGRKSFYAWSSGECCPDARALQAMAQGGYDVVYILTGRKTKGIEHEASRY